MRKIHHRLARALARLGAAQEGTTAVEFALIAPAFIAVLVAIFQVAVFLFAQQALQNAAMDAGRLVMTGQSQGLDQSHFKSRVCGFLPYMFSCNNLIVVVQSYPSFAAANTGAPALYDAQNQPITNFAYNPGTPGQVVVLQIVYKWSVVSAPLGFVLANLPNGAAEMRGVTAFRVEPYLGVGG